MGQQKDEQNPVSGSLALRREKSYLKSDKMIEKVIENLKDRHVLLIFDNIDSIYIKKPQEFIAFLSDIFNNASKVNVLVTGFSDFEHLYTNFPLKFHDLKRLNDLDSAALLTRRAPRAI